MKKYLLSGLIGFGISVGCLLPPILHFVTGPLGSIIGGFVGGMKARAKWSGALVIGLTMGVCLGLFLVVIGSIIMSFQISLPGMMSKMMSTDSLNSTLVLRIVLIAFAYVTIMGTLGAFLGGKVINKEME